jgi:hypothetical protein
MEQTITNKRCTCDDFSDDPCPLHGYGALDCDCGNRLRVPLVPREYWPPIECPKCRRHFFGVETEGGAFWVEGKVTTITPENTCE